MRGRERIAETRGAIDLQAEAARRGLPVAIAEVAEAPGIAGAVEQLGVSECDLAGLTGIDREDTRADQPMTGELDQRGVTLPSHDGFVNRAGLCGVHCFAPQFLVALPERIAREDGLSGKGEMVNPFVHHGAVVPEPLFDRHACHAPRYGDLDRAAETLDPPHDVGWIGTNGGIDPTLAGEG